MVNLVNRHKSLNLDTEQSNCHVPHAIITFFTNTIIKCDEIRCNVRKFKVIGVNIAASKYKLRSSCALCCRYTREANAGDLPC
jgi:ribosomal protein S25